MNDARSFLAVAFLASALPNPGGWVQLTVPASAVGLEGLTVAGMTFAAQGGKVTWDAIGRTGSGN